MGYLFVLIALLAGATKGFLGKRISNRVVTERQSAFVNTVRMLMCIAISLITMIPEFVAGAVVLDGAALLWGTLTGITLSAFVVSWMLAVKHGAYTLVSVAQMFGTVINSADDFGQLFLQHAKVAVVPGTSFGAPGFVRWSYATSMDNIKKGLDRLENFLKGESI